MGRRKDIGRIPLHSIQEKRILSEMQEWIKGARTDVLGLHQKGEYMSYLLIENKGEIEKAGLRLLGATSKEGQDKIGFFGTGTKYAIATAMRNGIGLRIFSGTEEISLTTKPIKFRDIDYDEIIMDGSHTGLTTRMGVDCQAWFVCREFWCNALDETGERLDIKDLPEGVAGLTRIYIELTDEIRSIYDTWDSYFAHNREKYHYEFNDAIYLPIDKKSVTIYRRGIRVHHAEKPPVFDYDIHGLEINESRVVKSEWDVEWRVLFYLKNYADSNAIDLLLASPRDAFEWTLDWDSGGSGASLVWKEKLIGLIVIPKENAGYYTDAMKKPHVILPMSCCLWLHKAFGKELHILGVHTSKEGEIKKIEPNVRQKTLLADAIGFLKFGGFDDIERFPIHVAELDKDKLGLAKNGEIYIGVSAFDAGRRAVVETLLEEYAHLTSEQQDETREFQNVLIRFITKTIENQTGKYL